MAIEVKALLSGVETTFTDLGNNVFEAVLTAPNHDGLYEIEINAVSQTGDSTGATVDLTVASWITSKIDWKPTDRFNIQDFNRIRNNMISLWELLQWEFGNFTIEDMGSELTEYTGRWNVNHFNAFEKNLEIFRTLLPIDDFGLTQTFYYNGMFIKYDELNRIENLLLSFRQYATSREAGIRKLPFRLGAFREVRI